MKKLVTTLITVGLLFSSSLMAQETQPFKASVPEKTANVEQEQQLERQLGTEQGGVNHS